MYHFYGNLGFLLKALKSPSPFNVVTWKKVTGTVLPDPPFMFHWKKEFWTTGVKIFLLEHC